MPSGVTAPSASDRCVLCDRPFEPSYDFGAYRLGYCDGCELGRLLPMPSEHELAALYASPNYFQGTDATGYADYAENAPRFARTFRAKLGALLATGPVRALLEIGCGPGYFLAEARAAGIETIVGIDRSPWAAEHARARGFDVRVGELDVLPHDATFDAVVMLDLFEHITAPREFLLDVRARLAPGGRMLMMTPNVRSLLARVSGKRWVSFKVPEHVYYYGRRSLAALLDQTGFDVLAMRSSRQYVTLAFALDRAGRIAPALVRPITLLVDRLGLRDLVVSVPNGSLDVVARARRR